MGIVMKTKRIAPTSLMTVSDLATLLSTKQTMRGITGEDQEALYLGMLISQALPMNSIVAFLQETEVKQKNQRMQEEVLYVFPEEQILLTLFFMKMQL